MYLKIPRGVEPQKPKFLKEKEKRKNGKKTCIKRTCLHNGFMHELQNVVPIINIGHLTGCGKKITNYAEIFRGKMQKNLSIMRKK